MNEPLVAWANANLIPFGQADPDTGLTVPNVIQFNDGVYNNPVLSGTDSAVVDFAITNNFTKGTPVVDDRYTMTGCTLTTKKGTDGSMDEEAVKDKWVSIKSVSMGDASFTKIGAHYDTDGITLVEDSHPVGCGDAVVGVNSISGAANDGTEAGTGKNNIARVQAICHPGIDATAGKHPFVFRLTFTFGNQ